MPASPKAHTVGAAPGTKLSCGCGTTDSCTVPTRYRVHRTNNLDAMAPEERAICASGGGLNDSWMWTVVAKQTTLLVVVCERPCRRCVESSPEKKSETYQTQRSHSQTTNGHIQKAGRTEKIGWAHRTVLVARLLSSAFAFQRAQAVVQDRHGPYTPMSEQHDPLHS